MSKCFISVILFTLVSTSGIGQLSKWAPSAVRVGTDVGGLGYMLFSDQRSYFEIEGDIDFSNFFAVVDLGVDNYQISETTYNYNSDGRYLRFGLDVNFIKANKHANVAFFGVRYALSSFDDKLTYDTNAVIQSETGWPNTMETTTNTDAKGSWYELNAGMKVRVIKQLYLGFTARFKIGMSVKTDGSLKPYYVPGFGKNISSSAWGFSYYVYYRLPFRKKIIYTKTKEE